MQRLWGNRFFYGKLLLALVICAFLFGLTGQAIHAAHPAALENQVGGIPLAPEGMGESWKDWAVYDTQIEQPDGGAFGLLLEGAPAPFSASKNTYYIPQALTGSWQGSLTANSEAYTLLFAADDAWDDPLTAIAQSHPFRLYVSRGEEHWMCSVIFTGVPMLTLQAPAGTVFEGTGELTLFDPGSGAPGSYAVSTVQTAYHKRGATTASAEEDSKQSYKLSLQNERGGSEKRSLLGLRTDDDWILIAMNADPTRVRDRLNQTLWNEIAATRRSFTEVGCESVYAELCLNGEYQGLYDLTTRIDAKSLSLDKRVDYLYKCSTGTTSAQFGESTEAAAVCENFPAGSYKLKQLPKASRGLWEPLQEYLDLYYIDPENADPAQLLKLANAENQIDCSIFYCFTGGWDNAYLNNTYLAGICRQDGSMQFVRIPWDLDQTYQADMLETPLLSRELLAMAAADPALKQQTLERWQELRSGILAPERVAEMARTLEAQVVASGAAAREWYADPDLSGIEAFLPARCAFLDRYFAQWAAGEI